MSNVSVISGSTPPKVEIGQKAEETSFFGEVWDTINPLQHIPIISNIYRAVSGENISGFANVAGSTLFGGPISGAVALASEAIDAITGEDETIPALADSEPQDLNKLKTTANAYKMRVTTADWLNPNFNNVV